jgi:hypothetical protein
MRKKMGAGPVLLWSAMGIAITPTSAQDGYYGRPPDCFVDSASMAQSGLGRWWRERPRRSEKTVWRIFLSSCKVSRFEFANGIQG